MIYNYTKSAVNSDKLKEEVKEAGLLKEVALVTWLAPSSLEIRMGAYLTNAEEDILDAVVAAHQAVSTTDIVRAKISRAMDFGKDMMTDYATKRVIRGATVEDTKRVLVKLRDIQASVLAGSLYVALDQLENLEADADIPQSDIDMFVARIKTYLGIS